MSRGQLVPPRILDFYAEVPTLYRQAQATVHESYQMLLYQVAHAFQPRHLKMVEDSFGLPHPAWSEADQRSAITAMDSLRYPDAAGIASLPKVDGLTLGHVSHYLHFFHHAYPMMTPQSVAGLARIGLHVKDDGSPKSYAAYIAAIEELKEGVPFWDVPETNVYLTRIVQGALHAYGSP